MTNNSFIESRAFDGMRRCLAEDFSTIYVLDMGGNVRKNPKLSGTTHNVFGIQVGVSVNLLVRRAGAERKRIFVASMEEYWKKGQKYQLLDQVGDYNKVKWTEVTPSRVNSGLSWTDDPDEDDSSTFIPMGQRGQNNQLFGTYSYGNDSGRDAWVFNFKEESVLAEAAKFVEVYNSELDRWIRAGRPKDLDRFLTSDEQRIKWTRNAKRDLRRLVRPVVDQSKIETSIYRPYVSEFHYRGAIFNKEPGQMERFFIVGADNRCICVSGVASKKPFQCLVVKYSPCSDVLEKTQVFPFYTYAESGTNRRENITDWALEQFRARYKDRSITKWDVFHYIYTVLHHPEYRERYAANLRRELPRIPFIEAGTKGASP